MEHRICWTSRNLIWNNKKKKLYLRVYYVTIVLFHSFSPIFNRCIWSTENEELCVHMNLSKQPLRFSTFEIALKLALNEKSLLGELSIDSAQKNLYSSIRTYSISDCVWLGKISCLVRTQQSSLEKNVFIILRLHPLAYRNIYALARTTLARRLNRAVRTFDCASTTGHYFNLYAEWRLQNT